MISNMAFDIKFEKKIQGKGGDRYVPPITGIETSAIDLTSHVVYPAANIMTIIPRNNPNLR